MKQEYTNALTALAKKKSPSKDTNSWYQTSYDAYMNQCWCFCFVCSSMIYNYRPNVLIFNSRAKIEEHGVAHLKEHNLLAFI